MRAAAIGRGLCVSAVVGAAVACSGGAPAEPSTPSPTPPSGVTAIAITGAGVSPAAVEVAIGARVRFVNNDTVPHSIVSDPHPDNNDCPEVNQVGLLAPGQSRETGNFVQPRLCGFHDLNSPTAANWQGTITIK